MSIAAASPHRIVYAGQSVEPPKSDFANIMTLDRAGISTDENPFMPAIGADERQTAGSTELLRNFNLAGIDRIVEVYFDRGS